MDSCVATLTAKESFIIKKKRILAFKIADFLNQNNSITLFTYIHTCMRKYVHKHTRMYVHKNTPFLRWIGRYYITPRATILCNVSTFFFVAHFSPPWETGRDELQTTSPPF